MIFTGLWTLSTTREHLKPSETRHAMWITYVGGGVRVLLSGLAQPRKIKPIATVPVRQSLPTMLARRAGVQLYRVNMRTVPGGEPADDFIIFHGQQGAGDIQ